MGGKKKSDTGKRSTEPPDLSFNSSEEESFSTWDEISATAPLPDNLGFSEDEESIPFLLVITD